MRSLELLMERNEAVYFPAHGGPVRNRGAALRR
jgi:hypothetical protein